MVNVVVVAVGGYVTQAIGGTIVFAQGVKDAKALEVVHVFSPEDPYVGFR